jgi:glutamate carboxypeptidase
MDARIAEIAPRLAAAAERELELLVNVSSPSGDVPGAEAAIALAVSFMPPGVALERLTCSTPGCADDLLARLNGTGSGRVLLLGHLDTVVSHAAHRPLERDGDRLTGSGTVDMKGGDALALGLLRELSKLPDLFEQLALLLVVDEEWRTAPFVHAERFADFDACLCFEAGERTPDGDDAVIVKRKAAGTLNVEAHGRASHSGSAPHKGRSALLALTHVAQLVAEQADPDGPGRLTAVPTVLHSGDAFNVVPAHGQLICDLRADRLDAFADVLATVPAELAGVRLDAQLVRAWPGMDAREATRTLLPAAADLLGRPIVGSERGGASDASHFASRIPLTIDGLGPRGGGAHHPDEWVGAASLRTRAEVALALLLAVLERPPTRS